MKKSIVALLFVVVLSSSCASYYCPTYSKAPKEELKDQQVIKSERI